MEATTQIAYIPDLPARTAKRVRTPWRGPRVGALVEALACGAQVHEDLCHDLTAGTLLPDATGNDLDQWGELVGEQRLGLSDTEYRPFIQARMLVNRCTGTTEEMMEILRVAAGPDVQVFHERQPPIGCILLIVRQQFLTDAAMRRIARLISDARPAWREVAVIEHVSGGFGWVDAADFLTSGFGAGSFSRVVLNGV